MASLMEQTLLCRSLVVVALIHLTLSYFQFHVFRCPLLEHAHLPCPGCGLTRGMNYFAKGEFATAMEYHAFAPLAILVVAMMLLSCFLPVKLRKRICGVVGKIEAATCASQVAFLLLLAYWVFRIAFHRVDLLTLPPAY